MFKGEGFHSDDNEYRNVRDGMNNPEGTGGFVPIEAVTEEDSDPLEILLKAEKDATNPEEDTFEDDESGDGGEDDVPTLQSTKDYSEHGVATEEEAEVALVPTSGERAPRMPRIKDWLGLRKENKTDEERGAAERGKR